MRRVKTCYVCDRDAVVTDGEIPYCQDHGKAHLVPRAIIEVPAASPFTMEELLAGSPKVAEFVDTGVYAGICGERHPVHGIRCTLPPQHHDNFNHANGGFYW